MRLGTRINTPAKIARNFMVAGALAAGVSSYVGYRSTSVDPEKIFSRYPMICFGTPEQAKATLTKEVGPFKSIAMLEPLFGEYCPKVVEQRSVQGFKPSELRL